MIIRDRLYKEIIIGLPARHWK